MHTTEKTARPAVATTPTASTTVSRKKSCPVCRSTPSCSHTPAYQMRHMLTISRRHGIIFDDAWAKAWMRVRWPHDTTARREWKACLEEHHSVWRTQYERTGNLTRQMVAVYNLMHSLEPEDD